MRVWTDGSGTGRIDGLAGHWLDLDLELLDRATKEGAPTTNLWRRLPMSLLSVMR
jgi:hypothetical protein